MAHAAIPTPALEPEERKAPWPLRYTLVSCPRVYLLFFALRARVALVAALKGLAFRLGLALVLFLRFLTATFLSLQCSSICLMSTAWHMNFIFSSAM